MFSDVTAEIFHVTPAAKLNDSPDIDLIENVHLYAVFYYCGGGGGGGGVGRPRWTAMSMVIEH